jgi:V8-like Glu-specific endopeptidase
MVIIALVGVLAVAATATQALSIGTQSSAAAAASTKAVGALFSRSPQGKLGTHFCTGTVVHSPSGDVVVTAAHCLSGQRPGSLAFIPGYHHGVAPLGVWVVKKLAVDPRWAHAEDPDHDFAFLVVGRAGSHSSLEALTGAEQMRIVDPAGKRATVVGYPATANHAIKCSKPLRAFSPTQLEFDCDGYTNGTSGSALVVDADPVTGLGTVVGVIGGYQQGGNTPSVSYAAAFSGSTWSLYRQVVKAP